MIFNNKTFVISGANGWLGRSILDYISGYASKYISEFKGCEVICLVYKLSDKYEFRNKYTNLNMKLFELDLYNPNFLNIEKVLSNRNKKDILFIHSAGLVHPVRGCKEWDMVNVIGSTNFFKLANLFSSHVVVISSNSPFGTNSDNSPFDERTEYKPYLGYGRSKWMMELAAIEEITSSKLTILRPPWFYGPNQPPRQNKFYELIRNDRFPLFDKNVIRSKAHVYNIAHAVFCSIDNQNQRVLKLWISDEKPYSIKEIISIITKAWIKKGKKNNGNGFVKLPSFFADLFYLIDCLLQFFGLYNSATHVLGELNKSIFCDISEARKSIKYNPTYNLENSIDDII